MINAGRTAVGGGIGAALGQALGFPRQALVEPILQALGLPKNAEELAPQGADDSMLTTILKSLAGTGFEMATDPLTYAGGLMGRLGKLGGVGRTAAAAAEGVDKSNQIDKIRKALALGAEAGKPAEDGTGLIATLRRAMTGGDAGDIAAHQQFYESQAPNKLKQLLEAVRNPKVYGRATQGAQDLLESTGMGFKTDGGLQMMGLDSPTSLVKGRGGVLMTPQEQFLSMRKSATPNAATWGGINPMDDKNALLSKLLGNLGTG